MKTLFAFLLVGSLAVPAFAADPVVVSSTQMQLTTSPVFLGRIQYFLVSIAGGVLSEAHATVQHACRFAYAVGALGSPAQSAANVSALVAGSTNVVGTAVQWSTPTPPNPLTNPYEGQWDSSASDAALLSQITTLFNTFARCDTGT